MTGRSVRVRIAITASLLGAVFVVLIGRSVQLTVIDGGELRRMADRQHLQSVALPAKRGAIVDRFAEPLALTRESADIYLRPRELKAGPETLSAVARLLDLPAHIVTAKASSPAPFVWLDRQAPLERWAAVEELGVPGIASESARQRFYPHGSLAAHILGFTGIDGQGLEGVERALDVDLRGAVAALDVEHDARGREMVVGRRWRPLPRVGAQVELTIDAALQHVLENELAAAVDQFGAKAGSSVILDPFTGEVLAMANVPTFDPNDRGRATADEWRNRVITDTYEPGSTFKAIMAASAIENGVVNPEEQIFCENGHYAVGRRTIHDSHPLGMLTFAQVIQHSSNIGSAKVAERLGRDRLAATIEKFGFGRPTGIDLPGEVAGTVRPVEHWGRIHLMTTAFGQGISVTPLQLARAFAAIANGGLLMRPYVVRRVIAEDGHERFTGHPEVQARVMSPETARVLTGILRGVVEAGTGTQAKIEGFTVAGKTGTAQKVDPLTHRYSPRDRMSSFIGYVPAEDPRLVILVILDTPTKATYGGTVAAPVFKKVAEYGLERRGVRQLQDIPMPPAPSNPAQDGLLPVSLTAIDSGAGMDGKVPNLLGLSMRDAIVRAHAAGMAVNIDGSGYVIGQEPPPGAQSMGEQLSLKFGSEAY